MQLLANLTATGFMDELREGRVIDFFEYEQPYLAQVRIDLALVS